MKENYNSESIVQMDALDHIRARPGMYVGETDTPTKLLIEGLDNALDEVQAGFANSVLVSINKDGSFEVADNGRGIPFNPKDKIENDRPVLICNSIFTSGKFKKGNSESVYNVAVGLHGVGMTAVRALSKEMSIVVIRKTQKAIYKFFGSNSVEREFVKKDSSDKWSTYISVLPDKQYFETLTIDSKIVKERLIIAAANFPNLNIEFNDNGQVVEIKGSESELVAEHLGKTVETWFPFESKFIREFEDGSKCAENCKIIIGWEFESPVTKTKEFTTVNLAHVLGGIHITKISNIIKSIFQKLKKNNYEFDETDPLNWLRIYINLKIIDPHFDSQTKERLSRKTQLEVMDNLETVMETFFKKNKDVTDELMERFQVYRMSLKNKKVLTSGKKGSTSFTKLKDCRQLGGELVIGEGDSAMKGVAKMRDPDKHAVLPLKGKIMNAEKSSIDLLMKNPETKDIITALGCGIAPHCDITKLKYDKVIIAADADPDGAHITSLLITLFAKITPDIVKAGKLYVCEAPLYGTGQGKNFVPLWSEKDINDAKNKNKKIDRYKGLGSYGNKELAQVILDPSTRKLIQIEWSKHVNRILELMAGPSIERKKLSFGEWEV